MGTVLLPLLICRIKKQAEVKDWKIKRDKSKHLLTFHVSVKILKFITLHSFKEILIEIVIVRITVFLFKFSAWPMTTDVCCDHADDSLVFFQLGTDLVSLIQRFVFISRMED